jgi:hypothetical protein
MTETQAEEEPGEKIPPHIEEMNQCNGDEPLAHPAKPGERPTYLLFVLGQSIDTLLSSHL